MRDPVEPGEPVRQPIEIGVLAHYVDDRCAQGRARLERGLDRTEIKFGVSVIASIPVAVRPVSASRARLSVSIGEPTRIGHGS